MVYISCITNIPDSIILFKDEDLEINKILGIEVDLIDEVDSLSEKNVIQTVTQDYNDTEIVRFGVELFGIKVKEISVDILEEIEVVPLGGIIGMLLGVPVATIIYTLLKNDVDKRLEEKKELINDNIE